jgi:hypothetical protein
MTTKNEKNIQILQHFRNTEVFVTETSDNEQKKITVIRVCRDNTGDHPGKLFSPCLLYNT